MSIRRILVPLSGESDTDRLVESAMTLAGSLKASLQGVFVKRPYAIVPDVGIMPVPGTLELLIAESEKQMAEFEKRARGSFEAAAKSFKGVSSELIVDEGMTTEVIANRGRLADLSIAGDARTHAGDFWQVVRDELLFGTGRPVLVLPEGRLDEAMGGTVLVAWKSGREAARALAAALPFIATAKSVHVVSVREDETSATSLKNVEAYLALHNAKVTSELVEGGGRAAGAVLLAKASENADPLLVMGAYGRWRLRERIFGGVTEQVLHETQVPVLLAH